MDSKRERAYQALEFLEECARREASYMLDSILYHEEGCERRARVEEHMRIIGWGAAELISFIGYRRD